MFWRSGYDATSLAQLEDELGVNRSTLYSSFGGKAGLYDAAVDHYIAGMNELLVDPLVNGQAGITDLVAFVERLRSVLTDPDHPAGCLIVNAMGSSHPPAAMQRYLAGLRVGFDAALRRAIELGEIASESAPDKASSILTSAIGLNLAAKAGFPVDDLHRLVDGVRAVVAGWALDTHSVGNHPGENSAIAPGDGR